MSRSARALAAALALSGGTASAETLDELRAGLAGREVSIAGFIGTGLVIGDDEALTFMDAERNSYPVVMDAGREARRATQGCRFQLFGGTPCAMTGMAEIDLDGSRIRLILYEILSIEDPAEMPRQ